MNDKIKPKKRNPRHEIFKDAYLKCWNGTDAYLVAYPKASRTSARACAADLLAIPSIKADIDARIQESHMSADEALKLTADIARGDMAELMDITSVGFNMDLAEAKARGLTKLIKKVRQKTTTFISKKPDDEDREVTELEVELYDAQAAQRDILKMHGKFTERVDITSGGKPLTWKDFVNADRDPSQDSK